MTCREFWRRMPELETGPEESEHTRQCAACAALLERQQALAASLRRLAMDGRTVEAPARLEASLRAAFREHSGLVGAPFPARNRRRSHA